MLLVERIRSGKPEAWNELISQYEGRLLSFVESRLRRRAASEDVVQETFIGFLTSLPNYDTRSAAGKLPVFDRGPQADRPPASRRTAAGVAALVDRH